MSEEKKQMNLHQKLVEVRKSVVYIKKTEKGHNHSFANGANIIGSIRGKMDELNVLLIPNMESFSVVQLGSKNVVQATISYTWTDADNPKDQLKCSYTYIEDKQTGCQSIGALQTYAERYFLYKFFQVATDKDDPDTFLGRHNLQIEEDDVRSSEDTKCSEKTMEMLSDEICQKTGCPDRENMIKYLYWIQEHLPDGKNVFGYVEYLDLQRFVQNMYVFVEKTSLNTKKNIAENLQEG
jgi:hypothetical protein